MPGVIATPLVWYLIMQSCRGVSFISRNLTLRLAERELARHDRFIPAKHPSSTHHSRPWYSVWNFLNFWWLIWGILLLFHCVKSWWIRKNCFLNKVHITDIKSIFWQNVLYFFSRITKMQKVHHYYQTNDYIRSASASFLIETKQA